MPVDFRYASAFLAIVLGSLVYSSFVIGSTMLQMRDSVGASMNGSITAVIGSGTTSISLAWIGCQPRIDEPSKPSPSSNISSFNSDMGIEKCCQMPTKSRNFMSTILAFFSFANCKTSFGVILLLLLVLLD